MFIEELKKETNRTLTENGDDTNISTLDPALDFFALGAALRGRPDEFIRLFRVAFDDDPLTALRTLFYIRDIRGGQGERDLFREGLRELARLNRSTYEHNLHMVPEYGRWDDILAAGVNDAVLGLIHDQLLADIFNVDSGNSISLLAKWLPSENASSQATRDLFRVISEGIGLSPRLYRKTLSKLRSHIHLLEQDMSANQWDSIEYSKLPSQAHRKHVKAFNRHTQERYAAYLAAVTRKEKTINTSTLYTYEVYEHAISHEKAEQDAANVMWENLPDYTQGNNALVMADVSFSMTGRPMSVAVSLALYFAERNKGPFKDYFMTFSSKPQLVKVLGDTLIQRLHNISAANWGMSTNLRAAFDAILNAAVSSQASAEDIPKTLYIISDMEFDGSVVANESTFETAKRTFQNAGFELPHVVFWNVDARNTSVPATKFDKGVSLVSGFSQSTFRQVMEGKSPRELLDEIVHSERYAPLVVVSST